MKGRVFAAVVLSALLLLSGLGIGGWWLLWQRGPLQLSHQPLTMPRAARFVPASASFSLYLLSDGQRPVDYARAVAPARQRRPAGEAIARLRDGAFAAAGLDYQDELAGWLGGDIAMALFEDPVAAAVGGAPEQPARGWLLALASRDDDGARRFLQRFWQTRSLAGTDLQVSRYRGMGLISGRGALLGSRPEPLASALVDDDLVLIASGRNLLERALDVSQIPELNQAGQPLLRQAIASFGSGVALAVASPAALQSWLGLPAPAAEAGRPQTLLSEAAAAARGLPRTAALAAPLPDPPEPGATAAELPDGSPPLRPGGGLAPTAQAGVQDAPPAEGPQAAPPQAPAEPQSAPGPRPPAVSSMDGGSSPAVSDSPAPTPSTSPPLETDGSPDRGGASSAAPSPSPRRSVSGSAPRDPLPTGLPTPLPPAAPSLVAVLQPQGRQLELRARLLLPQALRLTPVQPELARVLQAVMRGSPSSLALVQDPASMLQEPLLRPLLERSLGLQPEGAATLQGALPSLLAHSIHGPLLASRAPMGWQLASRAGDPPALALQQLLREEGLLEAPLSLEDHSLRVWTHLSLPDRSGRHDRGGTDALEAPLAGWSEQRQDLAWWGESLAALEAPAESRALTALQRGLHELGVPQAPLQWSLDGDGARALLRSCQPWRLLSALAGGGLDGPVRGLALAVESPPEASALDLRARLLLGT